MTRPFLAFCWGLSLFAAGMGAGLCGAAGQAVAVAPQYDTTHVYVAPEDFDRFTASLIATFGGSKSKQGVFQVTPTPSPGHVATRAHPGGHFLRLRLQDADPVSLRPRADRLPGVRHWMLR